MLDHGLKAEASPEIGDPRGEEDLDPAAADRNHGFSVPSVHPPAGQSRPGRRRREAPAECRCSDNNKIFECDFPNIFEELTPEDGPKIGFLAEYVLPRR
ncbi:MAG: hypothetical protein LV481_09475 [Methylacidiphilales bacterium]|nr:hypothetical protein [Candidatus Methylacidiphilales bacterium]